MPEAVQQQYPGMNERYEMDNEEMKVNGDGEEQRVYADLVSRIDRFLNEEKPESKIREGTKDRVREALSVIQEALQRYQFDTLALSFNGGKDCLVLLLLYIYILHTTNISSKKIPTCFVTPPQTFTEVDSFVTECATRYNLDVERISLPMKPAFTQYLTHHPQIQAVLVGTRRTDPHGEFLSHFNPTDHGWPDFMRIHPVINWHYWEIWDFLRALEVPYCVLYDRGFTSLGGTLDTHPNPSLKTMGGNGFMPAYELMDESKERCGRDH